MAKVGRAARVASRQRTENIGAAGKTIQSAETGELYIVNSATPGEITLPTAQDGAYFKIMFALPCTGNVVLNSQAGEFLVGTVTHLLSGANVETTSALVGNSRVKVTLSKGSGGTNAVGIGSMIECYSDGSHWYLAASIVADHADNAATFA